MENIPSGQNEHPSPPPAPPEQSGELQFDRPEYGAEGNAHGNCAICARPLLDYYFTLNDKVFCPACRQRAESMQTQGSGLDRFVRAVVFGIGAAAPGAIIHYLILEFTGYELALITILIGYMVGTAVRKGSNGRGGWVYQTLAVFLTYMAIVTTYIPTIIKGVAEGVQKDARKEASPPAKHKKGKMKEIETAAAKEAAEPAESEENRGADDAEMKEVRAELDKLASAQTNADKTHGQGKGKGSWVRAILLLGIGVIFIFLFAMAVPIITGVSNPIMLLIIIFGLWEAWKLNRKVTLSFGGPFKVGGETQWQPPAAQG
ncbi:hypothetical protein HYR69_03880 [Candidatus Sumerlaeota bacterium]|nr:hypothetical protein [Candidatus Sumerlaeota bacterium]